MTPIDHELDRIEERMQLRERFPEHRLGRSMHSCRLKYTRRGSTNRERAFARTWFKRYSPWIIGASWSSKLDLMLTPISQHEERPHRTTKREAEVAATVIQWLGTNVGFAFLEEALREAGYVVRKADS